MKKQVLAVAFLGLTTIAFAQKKEVKALEKAVKSEKFAQTPSLIAAAEKLITNADDKTKAKFYYLKAKALLNGTNLKAMMAALETFDGNGASKYAGEIKKLKASTALKLVNDVVSNPKDAKANEKLYVAYQLSGDQDYLYYAATGYVGKKDYKKALPLYEELKTIGYTGEKTQLKAYNKETRKDDVFPNKVMRTLAIKAGTHIKPTESKTPSVAGDIIKNIAYMYVETGATDKAIAAIQDARKKDPTDVNLLMTEANLYLKLGKKDKYQSLIKEAVVQDPKNATLFYNLGVMAAQEGNAKEAKAYYQKSLAIDPININTNFNLAALILGAEKTIIDQMNSLGTSAADNKKYDALQEKRSAMYTEAIPYLENIIKVDAKNKNAAQTLKGIYSALGNTAKYKEMKALLDSL